jgi:hypothetical protein
VVPKYDCKDSRLHNLEYQTRCRHTEDKDRREKPMRFHFSPFGQAGAGVITNLIAALLPANY